MVTFIRGSYALAPKSPNPSLVRPSLVATGQSLTIEEKLSPSRLNSDWKQASHQHSSTFCLHCLRHLSLQETPFPPKTASTTRARPFTMATTSVPSPPNFPHKTCANVPLIPTNNPIPPLSHPTSTIQLHYPQTRPTPLAPAASCFVNARHFRAVVLPHSWALLSQEQKTR